VAVRRCPQCLALIPAGESAAYSDEIECPGCKTRLEVAQGSRMLATWMGLAAGWVVWRLTRGSGGMLGWVLPIVYSFLTFSFISALATMFTADLRIKPAEPSPEPLHAPAGGPGGAHH
jgi:hypothetical protein